MKTFILASLALLAMTRSGQAQSKNFLDQPYLETAARADTLVTPDRIYLQIVLQESDSKGKVSLEALEQRMGSRLKSLGIDLEEQLTVSDLSSEFRKYFLRGQDIQKQKAFQLLVYDAPSAGQVLAALEGIGISNVTLLKTEYAEMDALRHTLVARAVRKARTQAGVMAEALEQPLGKAVFISDSGFSFLNKMQERGRMVMTAFGDAQMAPEPLPVDFEKIRVEASVEVKFLLE
jgi:uncharacterized protein YggE